MGPISAGRGRVISGRLANRCGSRFRTNTKLLPGVTGPISAPSDYLSTVFDDVILACAGAAETMPPPPPPPTVPMGKTSTCTGCCDSLPACVKSFANMLFVGQIETYSLRRALKAISDRNETETQFSLRVLRHRTLLQKYCLKNTRIDPVTFHKRRTTIILGIWEFRLVTLYCHAIFKNNANRLVSKGKGYISLSHSTG